MREVDYRSDFDFIMVLKARCAADDPEADEDGFKEIPFPRFDWVARLYTDNKANAYTVSYTGGVCTNCYDDGGRIHVVVNSPRMGTGVLKADFLSRLPNDIYPDGTQDVYKVMPLGIELVRTACCCPTTAEAELLLPYIKGEPFTFGDFTEEQLQGIVDGASAPALEKVDAEIKRLDAAETVRAANEELRVRGESGRAAAERQRASDEDERMAAEARRVNDEGARARDESARKADEAVRQEAERQRVDNEASRVQAEQKRAAEFAGWESELDAKADRTELSNVLSEPTENVLEDIEPNIVADALRKTEQALTGAERARVLTNLGQPQLRVFADLWDTAAVADGTVYGKYDPENAPDKSKPFRLYGFWFSYKEALFIYSRSHTALVANPEKTYFAPAVQEARSALLPCKVASHVTNIAVDMFRGQSRIKGCCIKGQTASLGITKASNMFDGCANLEVIEGGWRLTCSAANADNIFRNCAKLREVRLYSESVGFSIADSPLLSLASVQYMVYSRPAVFNSTPITITVHPEVYAKLADEANTDWHRVMLDGAEKNITFATA